MNALAQLFRILEWGVEVFVRLHFVFKLAQSFFDRVR